MPEATFDHIRRKAVDLLTRLTNPQLAEAQHYEVLDNDGDPNDVAEIHAMCLDGKWHVDVLFANGDAFEYAADDARQPQQATA